MLAFSCYAGEVMAVMGGSGSGKSSTLDVLAFRTPPHATSGHVYLNERLCNAEVAKQFIGFDPYC